MRAILFGPTDTRCAVADVDVTAVNRLTIGEDATPASISRIAPPMASPRTRGFVACSWARTRRFAACSRARWGCSATTFQGEECAFPGVGVRGKPQSLFPGAVAEIDTRAVGRPQIEETAAVRSTSRIATHNGGRPPAQPTLMPMYFVSRNSSMPTAPPSRPSPDALTPPNGAAGLDTTP